MRTINEVAEGLIILSKYNNSDVCAEHDIIYAGPYDPEEKISQEDRERLDELGWHIDSDATTYARFV